MYISSENSATADILDFDTALKAYKQDNNYDNTKWLYVPDFYAENRYILGTQGSNPLICIGINPSTAEPDKPDRTIKAVSGIAERNGFDSWIMLNIYAQRATKPEDMDKELNAFLHQENLKAFRYVLSSINATPSILAAWGGTINLRPYLKGCLKDIVSVSKEYNVQWLHVGDLLKAGHPHHPLYLHKNSRLYEFDISGYIKNVKYV